jgi:3-oxo-5-alpha-steroid 4-dehydrogenase 1
VTEHAIHRLLCWGLIGISPFVFVTLQLISAPYGRQLRAGWGPTIPDRLAWVLMESPAIWLCLATYLAGPHRSEGAPLVLLGLHQLHYWQRTLVYPALMRSTGKRMPLAVAAMSFSFNALNGWLIGRWLSALGAYPPSWLRDPRLVAGAALFLAGFFVNLRSDAALRRLRAPGESGYRIPRGGLFALVSCPNYLGEILEWIGWALASWSLPGLAFALFTIANLAPRALANHCWYRATFPDYPAARRALVPWVW